MTRRDESMAAVLRAVDIAVQRAWAVPIQTPEVRKERLAVFMAAMDYQRRERQFAREASA